VRGRFAAGAKRLTESSRLQPRTRASSLPTSLQGCPRCAAFDRMPGLPDRFVVRPLDSVIRGNDTCWSSRMKHWLRIEASASSSSSKARLVDILCDGAAVGPRGEPDRLVKLAGDERRALSSCSAKTSPRFRRLGEPALFPRGYDSRRTALPAAELLEQCAPQASVGGEAIGPGRKR
jgi:hypothetical protein